jgi:hypothetical protein
MRTLMLHDLKGLLALFSFSSERYRTPFYNWTLRAKSNNPQKIKEYCLQQLNTFLQLAKGSLMPQELLQKMIK